MKVQGTHGLSALTVFFLFGNDTVLPWTGAIAKPCSEVVNLSFLDLGSLHFLLNISTFTVNAVSFSHNVPAVQSNSDLHEVDRALHKYSEDHLEYTLGP